MTYTKTIGTCIKVRCINGPLRGLKTSKFPYPGCKSINQTSVLVQITNSCPADQNESNRVNCASDPTNSPRHPDLFTPSFSVIAYKEAGVVDILYQQSTCPENESTTGVSWETWEHKYNTTLTKWSSQQRNNTFASVESDVIAGVLQYDEELVKNRTGHLPPVGVYKNAR